MKVRRLMNAFRSRVAAASFVVPHNFFGWQRAIVNRHAAELPLPTFRRRPSVDVRRVAADHRLPFADQADLRSVPGVERLPAMAVVAASFDGGRPFAAVDPRFSLYRIALAKSLRNELAVDVESRLAQLVERRCEM